jgi:hypothetical protein
MTEALARQTTSNLAIADNAKAGDTRGTENIDSSDVRLPFIAIAQKTSKAIDPTETGKYIEGLKFLDMYNSETRQIYGQGPIRFIPIVLRKRAALLKENGTLGEPIAWDDPRATWEGARDAGRDKPEGQRIYDWAVLLLPSMELVILSFRSTSFGAGKSLNGFVKMRKPAFAGAYSCRSRRTRTRRVRLESSRSAGGKPEDSQFEWAEQVFESLKGANISMADDEEPEVVDAQHAAATPAATQKSNDDIPF